MKSRQLVEVPSYRFTDRRPQLELSRTAKFDLREKGRENDRSWENQAIHKCARQTLGKGKQEVSLSAFAFLFSELVQYNQTQVDNIAELERRLEDAGYAVGARVLELLCHREKGNRRETRLLGILSFIHSTVWKVLFGKVADSLEKGTEHEDEYMISEKELLVNRFISIPKDMGAFNCGAFVAGIVKGVLDNAGFPAVVTAHFVPVDGQQRPRTTILIKFAEEGIYP
ncbi:UNVERIFIED_CONTAM: Trafficking protein particle complex subunit [Sesamum latifolium]|uniref:Trafficking protein particle complex subunit n=1 Tax=Sesamum latifolium TaxID=2727402 RepID=A0AAW2XFM5_9LAMI